MLGWWDFSESLHNHRHESTPVAGNNTSHCLKPNEAEKGGKQIDCSESLHSPRHESTPGAENNTLHGLKPNDANEFSGVIA